jgi:type 1 fimbria pilin
MNRKLISTPATTSPLTSRGGVWGGVLFLLLWSVGIYAQTDDPFPDVNSHDYYGNMMMSVKVVASGQAITNDVIVAVYAGDEIRGKGSPQDPDNPGVAYLTVYGNEDTEKLTFKVCAKGIMIESDQTAYYTFNGYVGTPSSPYIIDISDSATYSGIEILTSDGKRTAVFDGNSEETVDIPLPLLVDDLEYNRTFKPGQPAAIILPFDITGSMKVTGCKFYTFDSVKYENTKWVVTMLRTNVLEANMPYIVMPEMEHIDFDFGGKAITMMTEAKTPKTNNGWTFHGTYKKIVWTAESNDYGYSERKPDNIIQHDLARFTDGDYILPLHCYLSYIGSDTTETSRAAATVPAAFPTGSATVLPPGHESLPDSIELRLIDDDPRSIDTVTYLPKSSSGWYTLDGRKHGSDLPIECLPIKPGLYIHNGKKLIVR